MYETATKAEPAYVKVVDEVTKVLWDMPHQDRLEFFNILHGRMREKYRNEAEESSARAKDAQERLQHFYDVEANLNPKVPNRI